MEEDKFFCLEVFCLVDTVAIVPESGYRYIIRTTSAVQKFHANYKTALDEIESVERRFLLKIGKTEDELEDLYVNGAPMKAYKCLIDYFKLGNSMSFLQKSACIKNEILGDKRLMSALRTHRFRWEGPNVTLCTHLLLTRQAWLAAAVFQFLFFLKNHFMGLFCWYDAHLSGKLKKS